MPTVKIPAGEVEKDDFLPGIGDGYVIDVEDNPDIRGDYNVRLGGEFFTCITFNTDEGDEGYLLVPTDSEVTVRRDA